MAKFQVDPSSESSSVNGDASPRTPPTPCLQGQVNGTYGTSMLCTRCVEMRSLSDFNSNATSSLFGQPKSDRPDSNATSSLFGRARSDRPNSSSNATPSLFGQAKSDRPDSKLDAPAPLFGAPFSGAPPSNTPTQRSAPCDTCYLSSCFCPKNGKPESNASASTSLFVPRCKTCNRAFCLCPEDKKPDSKSDAPAARSEASPCTGDIPISQRKWTFCTKCYSLFCPNATTTVGPPLCLTCRKPDCLGGLHKPGTYRHPPSSPKSGYVPKPGSLFTSGSPNSDGFPKGDNPDFKALNAKFDDLGAKFEALEAKCDDIGAVFDALGDKREALRFFMKSEFESLGSKFDVLIRNMNDVVKKL
ncbi:unnamed protein product [Clonostachys rhizophaga]|uniref:Uncharacterized protein n=1 Tax=Clonostachys rhizophaga TaxID=160324 RepID=A0A9N9V0R9_9HYPO|nr:unnamed protein product [Clonostachys rhizophaga]